MNKVDILFVVDVTHSMGSLISEAKDRMAGILKALSEKYNIDVKAGLSLYRDHPDQGDIFVTLTFDLMDIDSIKSKIDEITVAGGGDYPEAVIDGVYDGVTSMKWREGSHRVAFLIGDAPGHGIEDGKECCTCGKTWGQAIAAAEEVGVPIYAILLGNNKNAAKTFKVFSTFTGGLFISTNKAMDAILSTLDQEFKDVDIGSKVLSMLASSIGIEEITLALNIDRNKIVELQATLL